MSELRVEAATAEHRTALARLFDAAGSRCHCRYWHFAGDKNAWLERCAVSPEENRAERDAALLAGSDEARGVVAIDEAAGVVGWLKVTPAVAIPKLYDQRLYRRLPCFSGDRAGVFAIGCALVDPAWRRRGVATALVAGAVRLAPAWGATALEAFPRRPREAVSDEELWTGPMGAYAASGFVEVHAFEPYPVLRRLLVSLAALLALGGCSRCSGDVAPDAGPPEAPLVPSALPPPPRPWSFAPVRGRPLAALPAECRERAPTLAAEVGPNTRFVADARSLGALVIADAPRAAGASALIGVAAIAFGPTGAWRDPEPLPWFAKGLMPRLARAADGTWMAAWSGRGASGLSRIALWRGGPVESIGEGDGFDPVDLACAGNRCALLTTRLARVATHGADVWIGAPRASTSTWRKLELPSEGDAAAEPLGIAWLTPEGASERVVVALEEATAVVFREVAEEPREMARLPAPHGVLDVLAGPRSPGGTEAPIAFVYGTEMDDEGCGAGPVKAVVERAGLPPIEIATPTPPLGGALRRLDHGALLTFLAPLGCGAERKVVYVAVLRPDGSLAGAITPVADAASFAVATSGNDVDLWVQTSEASGGSGKVAWIRATCAAP